MARFALFPTSLGECGVAWREETVIATSLPGRTPGETAARLARRAGGQRGEPPAGIRRAVAAMTALLAGEQTDLKDICCDFSGVPEFEAAVYAIIRGIPPGETLTYGDVAVQLGDKLLAQNVGRALGRNPLPIIVPCHRVMGANGKPTGFSAYGGIETKLRMLAIEGAQRGLFDDLPP